MKLKSAAAGLVIAASLGFASTANATITLTSVGLQNLEPILNYFDRRLGGFGSGDHVRGRLACDPFRGQRRNRPGETPGGRPRLNPRALALAIRPTMARSAATVRQTCDRSAGAPARRSLS
jgi:hypothetical protein